MIVHMYDVLVMRNTTLGVTRFASLLAAVRFVRALGPDEMVVLITSMDGSTNWTGSRIRTLVG